MKRQANFEVLRVVAMAMIVAMHYMQKGGVLESLTTNTSVANCVAWLIESFCIVAANCYVLIAGYFLVETEWKCKKLFALVGQILFYSLLIPLVCLPFASMGVQAFTVYDWIIAVLPLSMEHYWFATAYVLLYLLSPVLAAGVKQLSKKQLELTIGFLLVYFCVFKSLSPILLSTDRYGYDYPWFICLFLIAAYIRLYGSEKGIQLGKIRFFASGKTSMLCYILTASGIFLFSFLLGRINSVTGKFDYYMNMVYSYNHILTLFASLSLFYWVKYWKPGENRGIRALCAVAPHTFAVYLIHENMVLRNWWPQWFGASKVEGSLLFLPYMLMAILCIFAISMVIDGVRKRIFRILFKL